MKTRTEITLEMDRTIVVKRRREGLASVANTSDLHELADILRSQQAAEPSDPPETSQLKSISVTPSQPWPPYSHQSKRS